MVAHPGLPQTRTCHISAYGSSDDGFAMQPSCMPGLLSWVVTVIRGSKYEASDVVPGPGSNIRHPLSVFPSLHRVLRDQFPGFIGTMRVLRLPAAHPAALRFLRLAVPRLHSLRFAPRRTSAPPRPGVGHPVSPAGNLPRRRQDLPSSWGISIVRLHMFSTDAGRTACTRPLRCSSVALGMCKSKGSHERSFDAQ